MYVLYLNRRGSAAGCTINAPSRADFAVYVRAGKAAVQWNFCHLFAIGAFKVKVIGIVSFISIRILKRIFHSLRQILTPVILFSNDTTFLFLFNIELKNLLTKRFSFDIIQYANATMAQLAEHILGKDEVIGSTPISSSKAQPTGCVFIFASFIFRILCMAAGMYIMQAASTVTDEYRCPPVSQFLRHR